MDYKTCTKCGNDYPADLNNFYKNSGGKYGLTPRCKSCVNEDNKEQHLKRLARNPEHVRELANSRSKKHYNNNIISVRERQRQHQAKRRADPKERELIQARKRGGGAGLTPEQIEDMFNSQGRVCAICNSTDPGSKAGWNLDHCHKTKQVRFILCAHCNRGLGAFKDDPELMRTAATKVESFNLIMQ